MKECTYLTCNRPSDSWEKAKKKWAKRNGEGAGLGREGKRSFYSLSLLFSSTFVFLRSPFRAPVHYAWNRQVHSGPEGFFQCRCKWSIDVHLGAFDILKAHTQAATIPALACEKRHYAVRRSVHVYLYIITWKRKLARNQRLLGASSWMNWISAEKTVQ